MSSRPPFLLVIRLLELLPWSDREVGEKVGRSHTTVYRWRQGLAHPSWGDMDALAKEVGKLVNRVELTRMRIEQAVERHREAERMLLERSLPQPTGTE